jgi:hypothetical protein
VSRSVFAAISQAIAASSHQAPPEPVIDIRPAEPETPPAVEPERDPIDLALNVLGIHNRYPSLRNVM